MKKKKKTLLVVKKYWQLYVFLLLPVIYIIVFKYIPMGGIVIAFKDYSVRKGIFGSDWVGFDNFKRFLQSYKFLTVLKNTLAVSFYAIIAGFPMPIIFALLLNCLREGRFKKFSQTVVSLPHFISTTVMVGILFQVFDSRSGIYGKVYQLLTGEITPNILGSAGVFRHMYVWSGVWQGFGWGSIIYIAALTAVDPSYHEAAQIDGASRFQRILYIDFPSILPTIVTTLILRMGAVMSVGFEKVFLMQNSLNISTSEVISTYQYSVSLASGNPDFSYATAIGLFDSVINLAMITIVNHIAKKVSETSLW